MGEHAPHPTALSPAFLFSLSSFMCFYFSNSIKLIEICVFYCLWMEWEHRPKKEGVKKKKKPTKTEANQINKQQ